MRLYRTTLAQADGVSLGFMFASSKEAASKDVTAFKKTVGKDVTATINAINVQPTRAGILDALNKYAKHADNG